MFSIGTFQAIHNSAHHLTGDWNPVRAFCQRSRRGYLKTQARARQAPTTSGGSAPCRAAAWARSRCRRLRSGGRVHVEASCPGRVEQTRVIGHEGG